MHDQFSKYRDPRWQKLRLDVFQRDGFTCQECGSSEKELHVHHLYYVTGRQPWDYPIQSLVTLCKKCHSLESDPETARSLKEWECVFLSGIAISPRIIEFCHEFDRWCDIEKMEVGNALMGLEVGMASRVHYNEIHGHPPREGFL